VRACRRCPPHSWPQQIDAVADDLFPAAVKTDARRRGDRKPFGTNRNSGCRLRARSVMVGRRRRLLDRDAERPSAPCSRRRTAGDAESSTEAEILVEEAWAIRIRWKRRRAGRHGGSCRARERGTPRDQTTWSTCWCTEIGAPLHAHAHRYDVDDGTGAAVSRNYGGLALGGHSSRPSPMRRLRASRDCGGARLGQGHGPSTTCPAPPDRPAKSLVYDSTSSSLDHEDVVGRRPRNPSIEEPKLKLPTVS